jgi:hypothetical protein
METYWGTHAEKIGFAEFREFVWEQRGALARYLKWASKMDRA